MSGAARLPAMVVCFAAIVALVSCGRVDVRRTLRVAPIEKPKHRTVVVGAGFRLQAKRSGLVVAVQVEAVKYCRKLTTQRAHGFRVTERRAVGPSLMMEWLMGGAITLAGGSVLTYNALNPPTGVEGELQPGSQTRTWVSGGAMTALGLALVTAAIVQQRSLGRNEIALGLRTLKQEGSVHACRGKPAKSGRLRLTLSDGHQIEADVGADGTARLPLPPDVDQRLRRDGRRATLEALGDWRSQVRISL